VLLAKRGGIARTATKIAELRNDNTIVMNIGDTYHGGAEALFSSGNDIVNIINEIGFDVGVPGNWDYAYSPIVTNARFGNLIHSEVLRPDFLHLAANIKFKDPDQATNNFMKNFMQTTFNYVPGEDFLAPTTMFTKAGIKIGVIGISSDIVKRMHPFLAMNLDILEGEESYTTLINTLSSDLRSQGANMVVVMSELGIHKDKRLADVINQGSVDVFFSAHTHELVKTMISSTSGAKIVEAGNDTYLGQLDVEFKGTDLDSMTWIIHPITQDITPDANIKALVTQVRQPYLQTDPNISTPDIKPEGGNSSLLDSFLPSSPSLTLHHSLEEVITTTPFTLSRKNALESSYNNAFVDMLRDYTGADVAMAAGFRYSTPLVNENPSDEIWELEDDIIVNGDVHTEDIYRFMPVPVLLSTATTSVSNLKSIIELNLENVFSTNAFNQSGGWFDGYSGLSMQVDLTQTQGNRLISLDFEQPKEDNDTITVAGCSRPFETEEGVLCSYSGFSNIMTVNNPDTSTQFSSVDFMLYAFKNNLLDSISPRKSITDISQTPLWPHSDFVQPLEGAK